MDGWHRAWGGWEMGRRRSWSHPTMPKSKSKSEPGSFWFPAKAKAEILPTLYNFLHILGAHMNWQKTCTVGARKNMLLVYYAVWILVFFIAYYWACQFWMGFLNRFGVYDNLVMTYIFVIKKEFIYF